MKYCLYFLGILFCFSSSAILAHYEAGTCKRLSMFAPGLTVYKEKNEEVVRYLSDGKVIAYFRWHRLVSTYTDRVSRAQVVSHYVDQEHLPQNYLSELIKEFHKKTGIIELKYTVSNDEYVESGEAEKLPFVGFAKAAGYKNLKEVIRNPLYDGDPAEGFVINIILSR